MFALWRRQLARCFWTSTRTLRVFHHVRVPSPSRTRSIANVRCFTTPPPHTNTSELPMERYHALSDATMESLLDSLEILLDGIANPNYEVEYHSGVLTLSLGEHGTYVINKQPPNKQIWLSSPISGPKRYEYTESHDDWVYSRDGVAMGELLNKELSRALDTTVDLGISHISKFEI